MAVQESLKPHMYSDVDNCLLLAASSQRMSTAIKIQEEMPQTLTEILHLIEQEHSVQNPSSDIDESDKDSLYQIGELILPFVEKWIEEYIQIQQIDESDEEDPQIVAQQNQQIKENEATIQKLQKDLLKNFRETETYRAKVNTYLTEEIKNRTDLLLKPHKDRLFEQMSNSSLIMVKEPSTGELVPVSYDKYYEKLIHQEKNYLALHNQTQAILAESMVEESKNLSLQVISLEKRLKELELLTEDDSGLFPNKHDEQMLDLLRENHFT